MLFLVAGCGVSGKKAAVATTTGHQYADQHDPGVDAAHIDAEPAGRHRAAVTAWPLVTDKPSGVSFRLPKKPTILTPPVTAPDHAKVMVRGYQVLVDQDLLVQVSVYDLAGRSFDADKAIRGVASTAGGTVTMRKHTASGDLDIVDAKIHIPKGPALGYDRVFKIGDHAVQMWTLGLASNEKQIRAVQSTAELDVQGRLKSAPPPDRRPSYCTQPRPADRSASSAAAEPLVWARANVGASTAITQSHVTGSPRRHRPDRSGGSRPGPVGGSAVSRTPATSGPNEEFVSA